MPERVFADRMLERVFADKMRQRVWANWLVLNKPVVHFISNPSPLQAMRAPQR